MGNAGLLGEKEGNRGEMRTVHHPPPGYFLKASFFGKSWSFWSLQDLAEGLLHFLPCSFPCVPGLARVSSWNVKGHGSGAEVSIGKPTRVEVSVSPLPSYEGWAAFHPASHVLIEVSCLFLFFQVFGVENLGSFWNAL